MRIRGDEGMRDEWQEDGLRFQRGGLRLRTMGLADPWAGPGLGLRERRPTRNRYRSMRLPRLGLVGRRKIQRHDGGGAEAWWRVGGGFSGRQLQRRAGIIGAGSDRAAPECAAKFNLGPRQRREPCGSASARVKFNPAGAE